MEQFRRYPAGVQEFKTLRTDGFVYVDKTRYVYNLANRYGNAIFLSRPRRFGKSLLCSTLEYYFKGEKELFHGLEIERLERNWTKYPVFHFDMSNCKRRDVSLIPSILGQMLSVYEKEYGCDGSKLDNGTRLKQLIETAYKVTGEKVVLLFDEYDAPVLNVIDDSEKSEIVRNIYQEFYISVKSMPKYVRFVFITGITKFSQMSIFSTINNLTNISLEPAMEGVCGITADELKANFQDDIKILADKYQMESAQMAELIRERYDGYRFGPNLTEVYNPYSLIRSFSSGILKDYWFDSATPKSLVTILDIYQFQLMDIEGTSVYDRDFDQSYDNMDTALPILYQSGYLTIKDYNTEENLYTLGIPNGEVYRGLYATLMPRYLSPSSNLNRTLLIAVKRAMLNDDLDTALTAVQNYLAALPHDLSNKTERDFETILRVIFDCIGIETHTEVKNARGRCDVVLKNRNTIYVLELKIDGNATVDDALAQINEKNYLIPYWNDPRRKVKVGVVVDPESRTIREWKAEE